MGIVQSEIPAPFQDVLATVRRIGEEVIGPAAPSVDSEARFPQESIDALRKIGLLSAYIPRAYGGKGYSVSELSAIARTLGQYCSSTAMIWAMHQIQVASLVHHGASEPFFQQYFREMAEKELLLASITSEVGVGGDIRSSVAAVERDGDVCRLAKKATTISYGATSDGFLVTARRSPEAAASDQVFVLIKRDQIKMVQTGTWNTMGMRGTCSPGFDTTATFAAEQILSASFAEVGPQSMVPFSHLLWSSCWLGIATDALARARKFMQSKARQQRATSLPGDNHLVEASALLQLMRSNLDEVLREYENILQDKEYMEERLSDLGFAIRLNNVKTLSSELVVQIIQKALQICGIVGYKEDLSISVTRHLRDAYSASLMISNDRIYQTTAGLLLVHKEQ